ncbi:MAG: hypothetical protein R3C12_19795 [Planctomycetaceae bacterium]
MFSGLDRSAVVCKDDVTTRVNIQGNLVTDYGRRETVPPPPFDLPARDSIVMANNLVGPPQQERTEQ